MPNSLQSHGLMGALAPGSVHYYFFEGGMNELMNEYISVNSNYTITILTGPYCGYLLGSLVD